MNPVMDAIIQFVGHYSPPWPDLTPAKVRINPGDFTALMTDSTFRRPPTVATHSIFGLEVVYDDTLPEGVWRVAASDDTLIYDSRQSGPVKTR
jgi:hypothetical protein